MVGYQHLLAGEAVTGPAPAPHCAGPGQADSNITFNDLTQHIPRRLHLVTWRPGIFGKKSQVSYGDVQTCKRCLMGRRLCVKGMFQGSPSAYVNI